MGALLSICMLLTVVLVINSYIWGPRMDFSNIAPSPGQDVPVNSKSEPYHPYSPTQPACYWESMRLMHVGQLLALAPITNSSSRGPMRRRTRETPTTV